MLKGLILIVVLSAAWVAALWFGVSPDFAQWSLPQLAAVHALPPLFSFGAWFGWRRWRVGRAEARMLSAELDAETERLSGIEAARRQATTEERNRRFGCDCRAVAMAQVLAVEDEAPLAVGDGAVHFSTFDPSQAEIEEGTSLLAHLRSGIHEALEAIYQFSPVATALPVYVIAPRQVQAGEFVAAVRSVQAALAADQQTRPESAPQPGRVMQLADERGALETLIGMFEQSPGLSMVLLGSDSPWLHFRSSGEQVDAAGERPGQGVFALLLTHANLERRESDLQSEMNDALLSLPVLARLHRPARSEAAAGRKRATEMARTIGGLIAGAKRNAGFSAEEPAGDASERVSTGSQGGGECGWVVHNSGTPSGCGVRMAGIGVALSDHGIELDPFDEATNLSTAAGDLGDAHGVGMLALSVTKAAATQRAVLCVDFCRDDALSLFFARPSESGQQAGILA